MAERGKVLVTGVSGFLGAHTAIQLLNQGYHVLGTLRDIQRAEAIKEVILANASREGRLKFAKADLLDREVWPGLMDGVDYVLHIASPFPRVLPKRDEELLLPARDGTLNVLRACSRAAVKRVVLTSSTTAIAYGKPKGQRSGTYSELDWTDENDLRDTTVYIRSKTAAERAAWDFINKNDGNLELVSICPGALLGPVLEKDFGTSANIVIKILDGSTPAYPKIGYDLADVRSVAELHLLAMESPGAAGERFIATAGYLAFSEIGDILQEAYPDRKTPRGELPNFLTRLIANFESTLKPLTVEIGATRKLDNRKAIDQLGWQPISPKEAVLATAETVIQLGLV